MDITYPSHTSLITADRGFFYTWTEKKKKKKARNQIHESKPTPAARMAATTTGLTTFSLPGSLAHASVIARCDGITAPQTFTLAANLVYRERGNPRAPQHFCEQCYSRQPDPSQTRARRPPCLTLSNPAISGQPGGHPVKMSTGSAVDPAAALLLVVARRGNPSQVFSGNASATIGWDLKWACFAYSTGIRRVINSPEGLWLLRCCCFFGEGAKVCAPPSSKQPSVLGQSAHGEIFIKTRASCDHHTHVVEETL